MDQTLRSSAIYQNRELSWLKFNERVLEESYSELTPIMEKFKFVAIYANNLDEFFMIRVGTLYDQTLLKSPDTDIMGNLPQEQLDAIFKAVRFLVPKKDASYKAVVKELESAGVKKLNVSDLSDEYLKRLEKRFLNDILPLTSPQIIDGRHPFPFLKGRGLYIAIALSPKDKEAVKGDKGDAPKYGIIPVASPLERVIFLDEGEGVVYCLLEEIMLLFADKAFKKYKASQKVIFRVTRNADIDVDEALYDYDIDFRDAMAEIIKRRRRLAAVRLQVQGKADTEIVRYLAKKLELSENQVFEEESPLDLSFVFALHEKLKARSSFRALYYEPIADVNLLDFAKSEDLNRYLRQKDLFFAFPYNSTKPFIKLLTDAADDPGVISIKITLYRLAQNSRIISALVKAAENGKDVMAVVELRARFDEENNISWSKQLEDAGVNLVYGAPGLKVHSKLLQITYKRGRDIEYVTQVGTGNYNEETAKLYTDFSLITMNKDIGSEASMVFNNLAIGELVENTNHLMVAPKCLKTRVVELIDREIANVRAGEEGSIIIKCNSISDKTIIDKFMEASQAGVKIKLFVRGICCFKPGVPGYTENITVKSIVGRLLEHSRIYVFGCGERQRIYISSADFMTRNTQNRVEVAAPIYDPDIKKTLIDMLSIMDTDTVYARRLTPHGEYVRLDDTGEVNSQHIFYDYFLKDAEKFKQFASTGATEAKAAGARKRRGLLGLLFGRKRP